MNAPGEPVERIPGITGLAVTAVGLCLFLGTASGIVRTGGIVFMGAGLIMTVATLGRNNTRTMRTQQLAEDSTPSASGSAGGIDGPVRCSESTGSLVSKSGVPVFEPIKLIESFNGWCEEREPGQPAWPAFDRWIRDALHLSIGARRVRCFHVEQASQRLLSLTGELEEPLWPAGGLPGLIDHVVTTGRGYVHGDPGNGDLIQQLVQEWQAANQQESGLAFAVPEWLWPVRDDGRTIGLIWVGEIPHDGFRNVADTTAPGNLLTLFWRYVRQVEALAVAERTDRTSGVLTRADLTERAKQVLGEPVTQDEPVVVLALAVEGLRRLDDQGHWQLRDALMRRIGQVMQARLRSDDLIGRFSEDRFVAVLRRLDLALGAIIARKLLDAVRAAVHEQPAFEETINIRCGVTDAGGNELEPAIGRAFEALRQARVEDHCQPVVLPGERQPAPALVGGAS